MGRCPEARQNVKTDFAHRFCANRPTRIGTLSGTRARQRWLDFRSFMTDTERSEEMLSHLAAVIEYSDDAIITKTLQGIISSWNPGAQRLFGYTAGEAVGQPVTLLIPENHLN